MTRPPQTPLTEAELAVLDAAARGCRGGDPGAVVPVVQMRRRA